MRIITGMLAALFAISACDTPAGPEAADHPMEAVHQERGVTLAVVSARYSKGDFAEARLINGSDAAVEYNFCLAMWDEWTGTEWRRVTPLRMCAAHFDSLDPGGESLMREQVEAGWAPGRYRFVLMVLMQPDGQPIEVMSNAFDVEL